MAHISGWAARAYGEVVVAADASTAFAVGSGAKLLPSSKQFDALSNSDTIMYSAVSLEDPTKWEVGLGTYTTSTKLLARTTILASSTGSAVNFKRADNSAGAVALSGLQGVASTATAFTITNIASATRTLSGASTTASDAVKVLAALIQDLTAAGVISAAIS